jgi:hypothetical protein
MGNVNMIPPDTISDVVERLATNAEAVCRFYLPNGRRQGRYWHVGDVQGSPTARCMCDSSHPRPALPVNGPMPLRANTAIFSTSSA